MTHEQYFRHRGTTPFSRGGVVNSGSHIRRAGANSPYLVGGAPPCPPAFTTLVVLTGLPGVGKSHLLHEFKKKISDGGSDIGRCLWLHKNQITAEYRATNGGRRPRTPQMLDVIRGRVASAQPSVIFFDMNINTRWLSQLTNCVSQAGRTVNKLLVPCP